MYYVMIFKNNKWLTYVAEQTFNLAAKKAIKLKTNTNSVLVANENIRKRLLK